MTRWSMVLGCALALLGAACTSDGDGSDGGVAGFLGNTGGGSGEGGSGGSTAGNGGSAAGPAGHGGMSSTAGTTGGAGIGVSGGVGGAGTGATGGVSGTAGASGDSGQGGSGGGDGNACGSRGLPACPDGSFCDFPESADCGRSDAPGTCRAITDVACGEIWAPVCGCDGTTYSSSCHASQAGVSIEQDGECGAGPAPGYQCVSTGAMCLIAPPECPEGQVPAVDGMCFGPCVPIEACDCDGPEDCPNPEIYACHMSAGHCGPYTN